jgi:hypothetical protein
MKVVLKFDDLNHTLQQLMAYWFQLNKKEKQKSHEPAIALVIKPWVAARYLRCRRKKSIAVIL